MVRLLPYVLVRIAGGPFEELSQLSCVQSSQTVEKIVTYKSKAETIKQHLCDILFTIIGKTNEPNTKVTLVNLKRDIYNNRIIDRERLAEMDMLVNGKFIDDYLSLQEFVAKSEFQSTAGENIFNDETIRIRSILKNLAGEAIFQKGLVLSSLDLLKSLNKFYLLQEKPRSLKKTRDTEQGLIKYLSRMYTKTSPYSTFTSLSIGGVSESQTQLLYELGDFDHQDSLSGVRATSHIRVNNSVYRVLKGILSRSPSLIGWFKVRPNPTLKKEKNVYIFLTNSDNLESFQRINSNDVIEAFLDYFGNDNTKGILFSELVDRIHSERFIGEEKSNVTNFLNGLIAYGLFEFDFEVSGIDPDWDINLVLKLEQIGEMSPYFEKLSIALRRVRELATRYSVADSIEREALLQLAHTTLKAICLAMHSEAGLPEEERLPREEYYKIQKEKQNRKVEKKDTIDETSNSSVFKHTPLTFFHFKPEQVFYEDTTLNVELSFNKRKLESVAEQVHSLLSELEIFNWQLDESDRLTAFFTETYGENSTVDLLNFYEEYYRKVKLPEVKKTQHNSSSSDPTNSINQIPSIQQREKLRKEWLSLFLEAYKEQIIGGASTIDFELNVIKGINQKLSIQTQKLTGSFAVYVQFLNNSSIKSVSNLIGVLNSPAQGFGKSFSRFLHLLDSNLLLEIRKQNLQTATSNEIYAELCDASFFNANIHPPLMPFEIWTPGCNSSLPPESQIPINDIRVIFDRESQTLKLIHVNGNKEIRVFDLGFQGLLGRSQLFRLQNNFSPIYSLGWSVLVEYLTEFTVANFDLVRKKKHPYEVYRIPRFTLNGQLVLGRSKWIVPKKSFPQFLSKDDTWECFCKINEWRLANSIPDEVFIFAMERNINIRQDRNTNTQLSRDDYKPQYINFNNPILVSLLCKKFRKVVDSLRMEEMLPGFHDMFEIGGKKRVTECILQWYS